MPLWGSRAHGDRHTCKTTSTGDLTAGEPQRVRTKRTVLQTRRQMNMSGIRISFLSAMEVEEPRCSWRASQMGRYSERAWCCVKDREQRPEPGGPLPATTHTLPHVHTTHQPREAREGALWPFSTWKEKKRKEREREKVQRKRTAKSEEPMTMGVAEG